MSEKARSGEFSCLVSYAMPGASRQDDRQWLERLAARHEGRLGSIEWATMPGQVDVDFDSLDQARAFMDELTAEGRFRINGRPIAEPEKLVTFLVAHEGGDEPRRIVAESYRRSARHLDFVVTDDEGSELIVARMPAAIEVVGVAREGKR